MLPGSNPMLTKHSWDLTFDVKGVKILQENQQNIQNFIQTNQKACYDPYINIS